MHGCGGLNEKCLSQVLVFEHLIPSRWHLLGGDCEDFGKLSLDGEGTSLWVGLGN